MAELVHTELEGIESLRNELAEIGRSLRSSFRIHTSSFRSTSGVSSAKDDGDDEYELQWAAIERLPTFERLRSSLFDGEDSGGGRAVADITKIGPLQRHLFMEKLIKHIEHDNLKLLQKIRDRIHKVGVKMPTIEVRYRNLRVEADCQIVQGKPLPTLWNSLQSILSGLAKVAFSRDADAKIRIIDGVSGVLKPGR
ncbi:hypothetical protein SAY86_016056 [Trapa natans]|uniref:Pleiotropic ABC efflux transporter N-terminal domain-containing protein n=1 Tax=Trapa natans TaxID=22666 RepID=A0AAN7QW10_TRANT|nr:hypothetical protein SAY86_016056 [Trapa natans]